ncbi:hypothetical protein QBC47DRAFT_423243 [Echria macrotheca]|uniref:DOMON domain-containing protein n=1 Tax=Echria macrotheca TaxID=438768 RepID=A0AAJ0BB71_9PEZI|nr:hypothetical protein QBC47DRAFT_423243 [Echria macrotheca]
MKSTSSLLAAALTGAGVVQGSTIGTCPGNANNVCYSVGVPQSSASSDSGNIYFQIKAPTTYAWVALGTGSRMSGSNLFIMYQDGRGNITLSPRRGTPHTPPSLDTSSTAAQLTLLDGSGVSSDGKTMVANVRCANCQSWNGGSMSLSSTSTSWVAGWCTGSSLATTDRNAQIAQHDDTAVFGLDLTKATVSTDSNPFTGSAAGGSGGSGSGGGSGTGGGSDGDDGNGNSGGVTVIETVSPGVLAAHGVVMGLVFAALYPLGSLLMPLAGKWWLHAIWQSIAFVLMWIGFGTGVRAANERGLLFNNGHTIFGTVVVCLLAIQPVLGFIHHKHFLATGARGPVSYAHVWYGRALLVLGVINGGVGLNMAEERSGLRIAYAIVAIVCFLAWGVAKGLRVFRNKKGDNRHHKEIDALSPVQSYASRVAVQMPLRTFIAPTVVRRADFVQELYLKELKAYKPAPIKESDAVGHVATFNLPKPPKSPEEADLSSSLKEYETMAVEIEGADAAAAEAAAGTKDYLVEENEGENAARGH